MHWPSFLLGILLGMGMAAAAAVLLGAWVLKAWGFSLAHGVSRAAYRRACRMASIGALSRSPRQRRPKSFPNLRARWPRPGAET